MNSTCLALRSLPALHLLEISGAVSVMDGEEKKVQLFQLFSLSLLFLCMMSYTYLTQTATTFIKSQVQEKQKSFAEISYKNLESTDSPAPMSFQSLHFPQGLTSEVCAVVTPISIDLSAFPLLFENDIMFPAASSGRQCEPAFL